VLRHQLLVLGRQQTRPSFRPADRAFLAALSRMLPWPRRHGLVVTPQTLLRDSHCCRPKRPTRPAHKPAARSSAATDSAASSTSTTGLQRDPNRHFGNPQASDDERQEDEEVEHPVGERRDEPASLEEALETLAAARKELSQTRREAQKRRERTRELEGRVAELEAAGSDSDG
jgi:hypothetical protein